jgi:hypothetical protein
VVVVSAGRSGASVGDLVLGGDLDQGVAFGQVGAVAAGGAGGGDRDAGWGVGPPADAAPGGGGALDVADLSVVVGQLPVGGLRAGWWLEVVSLTEAAGRGGWFRPWPSGGLAVLAVLGVVVGVRGCGMSPPWWWPVAVSARPHAFTCLDPAVRKALATGVIERLMREINARDVLTVLTARILRHPTWTEIRKNVRPSNTIQFRLQKFNAT